MKKFYLLFNILMIIALVVMPLGIVSNSLYAASLTTLSDTMSSNKIATVSNHSISFVTPTGVASGATIILTFQSDYAIPAGLTFADVDVLDNGTNVTLAATATGATWGVANTSTTVLTITNGTTAVVAGHTILIKIGTNATNQSTGTFQITNPTTTGTKTITMSGTFGDTGTVSSSIITNDTVVASGTVPQTISFAISSNTISFGTFDPAAAHYANTSTGSTSDTVAHTLAISTNGGSGYSITVQGATLTSGVNTIAAIGASPATSSPGTPQFGIYTTKAGGVNGTIATPYATASSFGYNGTAATAATFASGTTATATETYSLHYLTNISTTTPAGVYTASLVYVATPNF
jgi:hypothetical protein